MLETILISLLFGFLGGLLGLVFGHKGLIYEMLSTRKVLTRVMNNMYSDKSAQVRRDAKEDTTAALQEGMALLGQGKDIKEVGAYLLAKYPASISPILKSMDIDI